MEGKGIVDYRAYYKDIVYSPRSEESNEVRDPCRNGNTPQAVNHRLVLGMWGTQTCDTIRHTIQLAVRHCSTEGSSGPMTSPTVDSCVPTSSIE
jgi:hypothetical protein